ncbi:MAG: hypothetical protein GTN40_02055 [Candidatus Aenigmarchaeota archaeon]|nr:hypothetical protein [Candidatus Aenigmarchaeota archaeon]
MAEAISALIRSNIYIFIAIIVGLAFAVSDALGKKGSTELKVTLTNFLNLEFIKQFLFNPWIIFWLLTALVLKLTYSAVLGNVPLGTAQIFLFSSTVIGSLLIGLIFFNETASLSKIVGFIMIIFGMVLILIR